MATYYKISGDRLTEIANAVRAKTGNDYDLSPKEMAEELNAATLEPLTVTPTTEEQTFTPESPCIGFSVITVEAAPEQEIPDVPEPEEVPTINADEVIWGQPQSGEYLIKNADELTPGVADTNMYETVGYEFTVNETFAISGVLFKNRRVDYYDVVSLWQVGTTATLIGQYTSGKGTDSNGGWQTAPISATLTAGNTYRVAVGNEANGYCHLSPRSSAQWSDKITYKKAVKGSGLTNFPSTTYTGIGAAIAALVLVEAPTVSGEPLDEYVVDSSYMDQIATEVIRITGISEQLSINGIIAALKTVPAMTT